jgi:phage terminase large subunit-like protein
LEVKPPINPYFVIVDELHAFGSREFFDNLDTATGKRQGAMLWIITTAGTDLASVCYEVHTEVKKVLSGVLKAAVFDGRFHYNGDPILAWAISNVVCHRDKNDNLFPNKERFENKIDPATALLTALNRVMAQDVACCHLRPQSL